MKQALSLVLEQVEAGLAAGGVATFDQQVRCADGAVAKPLHLAELRAPVGEMLEGSLAQFLETGP